MQIDMDLQEEAYVMSQVVRHMGGDYWRQHVAGGVVDMLLKAGMVVAETVDKGQDKGAEMVAAMVVGGNAREGDVGIVAKDHIVVQSKEEAHKSRYVGLLFLIPFFGN
jgi:hypothetical protein